MEGKGEESYQRSVLNIDPTVGDKATRIFRNLFTTPLPYSGCSVLPLSELPKGTDGVRVLATAAQSFTTWNTQIHETLVSFGARIHADTEEGPAVPQTRRPHRQPVILQGQALTMALAANEELTTMLRADIELGKRWMTVTGEVLKRLPAKVSYRSAPLNQSQISNMRSASAPPVTHVGSPSFVDALSDALSDSDEAPLTGIPKQIPVRMVEPVITCIQGGEPTGVPRTQAYLGLEQVAIEKGPISQGLVPGTRSVIARDTPSVSFLISFMETSNASFIDTAPVLRALLYAYPHHVDAWQVSRLDRQFIRQQKPGTRSSLTMRVAAAAAADRIDITAIAVTLPAFAGHMKGVDTLLNHMDPTISVGFQLSQMDVDWVAVPVDSAVLHAPWLLEYIIAFLSTSVWNGRMNWIWHANYTADNNGQQRAFFTTIPMAHNVYVPGPTKAMLVLVDDNGYTATTSMSIPNHQGMVNVYPGSRSIKPVPVNLTDYTFSLTAAWYDQVFTTTGYSHSAERMLRATQYMERHLSTNMAFAAAVTLASELCSGMPEGPSIRLADNARNYTNVAYGAWTFGARNLGRRAPLMTTSSVIQGTEATRETNFAKMVAAYSFSTLSPCLQYAASTTGVVSANALHNGNYIGKLVRWDSNKPYKGRAQYSCHASHSVYRILRAMGYIMKNDYSYIFHNTGGLQNTLTNNGVLLTMSLSLALVKGDISLRVWTGLGADEPVAAHMSTSALVSTWTNQVITQRHPSYLFSTTTVAGTETVDDAFDHYYSASSDEHTWATHIPMPIHTLMQWAMKCSVELGSNFETTYGRVAKNLTARYSRFTHDQRATLPFAAATGDVHQYAPAVYEQRMTVGSIALPMHLDEWSEMTSGIFDVDVSSNRYQTNILAVSTKYHFQDTSNDAQYSVICDMLGSRLSMASMMSVDPLTYPDPPNPAVFRLESAGEGAAPAQDKAQEATDPSMVKTKIVGGPTTVTGTEIQTGVIATTATGPALSSAPTTVGLPVPAVQATTPTIDESRT